MLQSTKSNLIINNAVELGDNISVEDKGKGRHFTSRFIEAGLAHYQEFGDVLITKETLDKFIYSMVGCPVIIRHKDITAKNVDKERVGVVSKVWYNELDGWFWCEGIIWDKQAIDLIKNQGWSVSCTYDFESDFKKGTYHGKEYDMEFTGGEFLHLALVDNPRYERANIVVNSKDEKGRWITVKGTHIFIPEGKDEKEIVEKFIQDKQGNKKHSTKTLKDDVSSRDFAKFLTDKKLSLADYENFETNKKFPEMLKEYFGLSETPSKKDISELFDSPYTTYLKETHPDYDERNELNKSSDKKDKESKKADYNVGDNIKFDTNWRGVNPKISEGKIIGKEKKMGTKDDPNPDYQYKVKTNDGKTILVEKEAIQPEDKSGDSKKDNKKIYDKNIKDGLKRRRNGEDIQSIYDDISEKVEGTDLDAKEIVDEIEDKYLDGVADDFINYFEPDEIDYDQVEEYINESVEDNEIDIDDMVERLNRKIANNSLTEKEITMTVLNELESFIKGIIKNADDKDEKEAKNEKVDKRDLIRQIMAIAGKEEASEDVKTIAKLAEKLAYDKSEAKTADNKCKNEEDEEKEEKFEEEKEIANKKAKNEEEEKEEEEKAENKCKNSMDEARKIVYGSSKVENMNYIPISKRIELGNNY